MKTQIFKLVALTLFALGFSLSRGVANAQDNPNNVLVISACAYHFENFYERNALTPGLGWEYSPSGKIGWHVGTLSDSFVFRVRRKLTTVIIATTLFRSFNSN